MLSTLTPPDFVLVFTNISPAFITLTPPDVVCILEFSLILRFSIFTPPDFVSISQNPLMLSILIEPEVVFAVILFVFPILIFPELALRVPVPISSTFILPDVV